MNYSEFERWYKNLQTFKEKDLKILKQMRVIKMRNWKNTEPALLSFGEWREGVSKKRELTE